jgi:hypothetical protein
VTTRRLLTALLVALSVFCGATPSRAQTPAPAQAPAPPAASDPDLDFNATEPDFTLVALPTTLRMPKFKSAFRVTHRFLRPLNEGSFEDLLSDFFGLDNGAQIGLEYRFGILPRTQIGIYRTSDRTIEFFGQREVKAQSDTFPLTISALGAIDGTDNFSDSYTPALGAVVSRSLKTYAALYIEPLWINNSNLEPSELVDHNDTFLLGLAARLRVRPSVYLVFEGSPRVSGYGPGDAQMSFALEKRLGGHMFQLNVSNGVGTTFGQVARGGNSDNWYLGFNITRKFF